LIAVTSGDLDALVAKGTFRPELACRLKEHVLQVPPLRRRRDDLPVLVEHFCDKHAPGRRVSISPRVWAALAAARFPNNVRELELAIKHALAFHESGDLRLEHLPVALRAQWCDDEPPALPPPEALAPLAVALTQFEHQYLHQALTHTEGNRTRAAALLGISRKSLWAKLKRYPRRLRTLTVEWQR
jgi:DNA-binding NtrC family response regulator